MKDTISRVALHCCCWYRSTAEAAGEAASNGDQQAEEEVVDFAIKQALGGHERAHGKGVGASAMLSLADLSKPLLVTSRYFADVTTLSSSSLLSSLSPCPS